MGLYTTKSTYNVYKGGGIIIAKTASFQKPYTMNEMMYKTVVEHSI